MYITKNFTLQEFQSKDGAPTPQDALANLKVLAANLQVLRDTLNKPIRVTSGYRSPSHNAKVGGVKNSFHLKGMAADIQVAGMTPTEVGMNIVKLWNEGKMKRGWIKIYPNFVHYDIR